MKTGSLQTDAGWIDEQALYSITELRKRLDLGRGAIRKAKSQGLRVLRIGRRDYVRGVDLVRFALRINEEPARQEGGNEA